MMRANLAKQALTLALATGLLCVGTAGTSGAAANVLPGYNLFDSVTGTFNFNGALNLNAVDFQGEGIGTYDFGAGPINVGNTDTIVRRIDPASVGFETIDIEMVALSLRSVDPVPINAGPAQYIYVTFKADNGSTMTIGGLDTETEPHGIFTSNLDFDFDVRTVSATGPIQGAFTKVFAATPAWSHTGAPANNVLAQNYMLNGLNTTQDFRATGLVLHDAGGGIIHVVAEGWVTPTVSEWGLIIMSLLFASAGSLLWGRRNVLVSANASSAQDTSLPFDLPLYRRTLVITLGFMLGVIALAYATLGAVSTTDIAGATLSAFLLAYLAHVWLLARES